MPARTKLLLIYLAYRTAKKRRDRLTYVRPIFLNRGNQSEMSLVQELAEDPHYHKRYFRMTKANFDYLLGKIEHRIQHAPTHAVPISPIQRLAITLRYLASGNSQISLAMSYRVSPSAVSLILRETLIAICEEFTPECLPSPTAADWKLAAEMFESKWNFPNCCGAIDGKHVRMRAPPESGSQCFNYKGFFSLVLLAVVDADYRFTVVDFGVEGSRSDSGILSNSAFGKALYSNSIGFPAPQSITPGSEPIPHVIVGDEGFPLKTTIMRPYPGKSVAVENRIFNYRLSRARRVVENGFGILAARWRIFHSCIDADVDLVKLIIQSTVCLHNYLTTKNDYNNITVDTEESGNVILGNWRETTQDDTGLVDINRTGTNNYTQDAYQIRETFCEYFNSSVGSLTWQVECNAKGMLKVNYYRLN